tara:strand:+ start:569 stop:1192 length:624 start_codon:yes stop_codon:yes gene_type:complete
MFYLILIALAAAALYYFYRTSRNKLGLTGQSQNSETKSSLTIENVRPGGAVQLKGVGDEMADFDVVVKARHIYVEDGFVWYELEGEKGLDPVWIEIEEDDALELSVCLKKLKLSEIGITGSDIEAIETADKGTLEFEDSRFIFEDCGDARFFRNGDRSGSGERFRYWDFETKDGARYLTIERWGAKEYVAYLSEPLRPGQIDVYSLS